MQGKSGQKSLVHAVVEMQYHYSGHNIQTKSDLGIHGIVGDKHMHL